MPKKTDPSSHDWLSGWQQATSERDISEALSQESHWASSCFHALQSIEMALKALARKEIF